jgi:hypothetical protein
MTILRHGVCALMLMKLPDEGQTLFLLSPSSMQGKKLACPQGRRTPQVGAADIQAIPNSELRTGYLIG